MTDPRWLRRMLRFGSLGVAAMTALMIVILLARNTTGHDWRTAGKLTLVEAMLCVGFDELKTVAYHRKSGDTWNIPRIVFVEHPPVLETRRHILGTIGDGVLVGGGIGGTVFCLTLLGAAGPWRRSRAAATVEPRPMAYPHRAPREWSAVERIADRLQAGGGRVRVDVRVMPEGGARDLPPLDGSPPGDGSGRSAPGAGIPDERTASLRRGEAGEKKREPGKGIF